MLGLKKRIILFHDSSSLLTEVKLVTSKSASLITAGDRTTAEAALKLYSQVDVIVVEKSTMDNTPIEILATAKSCNPLTRRILIVESDAISSAYQAIHSGVVQEYFVKPVRLDQLRTAMGLPQPQGTSQAELAAILKRVNVHPPLTGGRSASSSPSLKG